MGYNDLSECTLTDNERVAEKDCIVSRLTGIQDEMTPKEREFATKMESANVVSVKQLFWLRDLSLKYD
jgi:hypothetical protein